MSSRELALERCVAIKKMKDIFPAKIKNIKTDSLVQARVWLWLVRFRVLRSVCSRISALQGPTPERCAARLRLGSWHPALESRNRLQTM